MIFPILAVPPVGGADDCGIFSGGSLDGVANDRFDRDNLEIVAAVGVLAMLVTPPARTASDVGVSVWPTVKATPTISTKIVIDSEALLLSKAPRKLRLRMSICLPFFGEIFRFRRRLKFGNILLSKWLGTLHAILKANAIAFRERF